MSGAEIHPHDIGAGHVLADTRPALQSFKAIEQVVHICAPVPSYAGNVGKMERSVYGQVGQESD